MEAKPELTLLYVNGESIGYGRLGVKLATSLAAAGVDVYDDLAIPAEGHTHLTEQVEGRRHKKTNVACWVSTPGHATGWWEGQKPAIFTMWEAMRLPEAYREHLHHFETVIVPSDQNVELFSQYHPNVKRCLLGVDTDQWKYTPRQEPGQFFNFMIGGSGARKGTDLAFKAFLRAFPEGSWGMGPVPRLIMKNPKGEDFYHHRVDMVTGRITAQEEIDLYATAHCYLQPSRGEGFGLQPLQAMAQGIPTILTDAHGHASFAHLGYGISTTPSDSSYFIYGDAGQWWEPSLDELIDQMRYVYDHYTEALTVGEHAASVVKTEFSWGRCAEQFIEAIGVDQLTAPYEGSSTWFTPEHKVYQVILKEDWRADIAGVVHLFQKGVTYYEAADVKRILFEAGKLDPACLESGQMGEESGLLDTGLTQQEADLIGAYSARHAFCGHCGQVANTGPVKADLLTIERRLADRGFGEVEIREVVYGVTG